MGFVCDLAGHLAPGQRGGPKGIAPLTGGKLGGLRRTFFGVAARSGRRLTQVK